VSSLNVGAVNFIHKLLLSLLGSIVYFISLVLLEFIGSLLVALLLLLIFLLDSNIMLLLSFGELNSLSLLGSQNILLSILSFFNLVDHSGEDSSLLSVEFHSL
jgi:hypothetical protein